MFTHDYLSVSVFPVYSRLILDFNLSILFPGNPPASYLSHVWVIYFLTGIFLELYELVFLLPFLCFVEKKMHFFLWPSLSLVIELRAKVYILYLAVHLFNLVLTLDPFELLVI